MTTRKTTSYRVSSRMERLLKKAQIVKEIEGEAITFQMTEGLEMYLKRKGVIGMIRQKGEKCPTELGSLVGSDCADWNCEYFKDGNCYFYKKRELK